MLFCSCSRLFRSLVRRCLRLMLNLIGTRLFESSLVPVKFYEIATINSGP